MKALLSLVSLLILALPAAAGNGVPFDLQGFLNEQLKLNPARVAIPPGRYRVTPHDRQHLVLKDLHDVDIVAEGVELICTQTTRAITLSDCRNVTLRGLTVDYDPLPFTQGRITALSADKTRHEIELFEGYPTADHAKVYKYEIFRPDTRTLRFGDYHEFSLTAPDARHLVVTKPRGKATDPEQVGDLIVIGTEDAPGGSIPHAIVSSNCAGLRFERVSVYASNCFGFREDRCDGTTYDHCVIDRRPPESDPVKRADPRLRSLDADANNSSLAVRGPAILGCVARFQGDDCVNISGIYHFVAAADGASVRVLAHGAMDLAPGEPVELVTYEGRRLPDAHVVAVAPDGAIRDEEVAFLGKQQMHAPFKADAAHTPLGKAFRVILDRPVELGMGALLSSARRVGNGFRVEGCTFGYNRSRGILLGGSDGVVLNNTLTENQGEAIKVAPEYWWLQAGSASRVVIRGNRITGCPTLAIAVYAHGGKLPQLAPAGAHHDITITDNTITGCAAPNILVTSTDGLRLEHNTCRPSSVATLPGHYLWLFGLDPAKLEAVMTINCRD